MDIKRIVNGKKNGVNENVRQEPFGPRSSVENYWGGTKKNRCPSGS